MKPLTVLLTGCGAPGTSGTLMALRQNFDNRPVRIVGVDVNRDTPGQQLVDAFATVFPPENVDYRTRLLDVCQRHAVDVVIPQTTREVGLLGEIGEWFADQGIVVMASPAAERANDKRECLVAARGTVIPISSWRIVKNLSDLCVLLKTYQYPPRACVVKPCISAGSRGVRIVAPHSWTRERFLSEKSSGMECTLEWLVVTLCDTVYDLFPKLMVMDYLPGREYSIDCFRGEHVQIAVPRIRAAMRDGISTDTTIVDEPEMARHALLIGKRLGLTGVYGVQFKANAEGVPCLLEVYPRVQGTMAASVLAGANVIWMGVKEAMGEPVTEEPKVRIGTRCVRHWVVSEWSDDTNRGAMT